MEQESSRTRRRRGVHGLALAGAGVVAGVVVAGLAPAVAQTPAPSDPPASSAPAPDHGPGRMRPGKGMPHGLRDALHGEFTTRAPGGGYQVVATQVGEVTAVSAESVTVRSEDGFARTYVVDDDTLVDAGDDGIADVRTGDTVHVVAVVSGDTARAKRLVDRTRVRESRAKWAPGRPRRR